MKIKQYLKMNLLLLVVLSLAFSIFAEEKPEIKSLLTYAQSTLMEKNAEYKTKMVITRGKKVNEYYLTMWTKNQDFVARTEKPAAQKGQMYLFKDNNCWIYYPTTDKVIKTSANTRLLGGDFSFVDIASIDLVSDYDASFITINPEELANLPFITDEAKEAVTNGYVLECLAQKGKIVTNPKVKVFISQNKRPVRMEFYTLSGQLLGILNYQDYGDLNGNIRPRTLIMRSSLNSQNYSTLIYQSAKYNVNVPDVYFTSIYLKTLSRGK